MPPTLMNGLACDALPPNTPPELDGGACCCDDWGRDDAPHTEPAPIPLGCPKLLTPKLLVWPKVDFAGCDPVAADAGVPHGDWRLPIAEVPPNAGVAEAPKAGLPKADV